MLLCNENLLIANTDVLSFQSLLLPGQQTITLDLKSIEAFETFEFTGIEVYMFCEDLFTELSSVWNMAISYFGGLGLHGQVELT